MANCFNWPPFYMYLSSKPFKSQPLNPKVFSEQGMLGVPHKPHVALTQPITPRLTTRERGKAQREVEAETVQETEPRVTFKAQPLPKGIFEKIKVQTHVLNLLYSNSFLGAVDLPYSGLFLRGVYFANFEIAVIHNFCEINRKPHPRTSKRSNFAGAIFVEIIFSFCEIRKIYTPWK